MKLMFIILTLIILTACNTNGGINMKLTSTSLDHERLIPKEFSCEGDDISPQLEWSEEPEGTKSFALSVIDSDAPGGDWYHWIIINIPKDTHSIAKNSTIGDEIENSFGKNAYGGPCPPKGHGKHRYFFTIYALDKAKLEGLTMENFLSEISKHTIAQAQMMGVYFRE